MTMDNETIASILDRHLDRIRHASSSIEEEDQAIRDYLLSILADPDVHASSDPEDLVAILSPFFDDRPDLVRPLVVELLELTKTKNALLDDDSSNDDDDSNLTTKRIAVVKMASNWNDEKKTEANLNSDGEKESKTLGSKSKRKSKQQRMRPKQTLSSENDGDDYSSAWKDCQEAGRAWGGRGAG